MELVTDTAASAYQEMLALLRLNGHVVPSRLGDSKEILGVHVVITNPGPTLIFSPERKFNYLYMLAETMWNLTPREDIGWLKRVNSGIDQYVEDQDDKSIAIWAYGPAIANEFAPMVEKMQKYPGTRRSVLRPGKHTSNGNMLVGTPPCTEVIQFLERDDSLHLHVFMRSNDAFIGFPYDLFTFLTFQRIVADHLDLRVGEYHHHVSSMHLYAQHDKQAKRIVEEGAFPYGMEWEPKLAEVLNGQLDDAMYLLERGRDYSSSAPSWHPGLHALAFDYDNMDIMLRALKNNNHGIWRNRTPHAQTAEAKTPDKGGEKTKSLPAPDHEGNSTTS